MKEKIEDLIITYKNRINSINQIINDTRDLKDKERLKLKIGTFRSFIVELERLIN